MNSTIKITNATAYRLSLPIGVALSRGQSVMVEADKAEPLLASPYMQAMVAKGVIVIDDKAAPKAAPEPDAEPKAKPPTLAEIRGMTDPDALADLLAGGLSKKRAEVAEARLAELAAEAEGEG